MSKEVHKSDVLLIGAGIMSATLGSLIKAMHPDYKIQVIERGEICGTESSNAYNNAGTGHAGFCELNYTPVFNGEVDVYKAVKVNESFEKSKQFWAYLVKNGHIENDFIHTVPHISFVHGVDNLDGFDSRYQAMKKFCLFEDIEYTTDRNVIERWAPLLIEGRKAEPLAATRVIRGTDINFFRLTNMLMAYIQKGNAQTSYKEEVIKLEKENGLWNVTTRNTKTKEEKYYSSKFVFIGAGGASLSLLQKSGIPEAKGYGGFPVSGEWLICDNPEIVEKHEAKVYGKSSIKNAPPMSVPHLDLRYINGKKVLLFGPYAGFSTKFLKNGSWLDLFRSIKLGNIKTMLSAALNNFGLTKYLVKEVMKSDEDKFQMLLDYYPQAKREDWKKSIAGQRVQVIKMEEGKGVVEFGTEIVTSEDGSLAALLGASPGASTSVKIMMDVLQKCFYQNKHPDVWKENIGKIIPVHQHPLHMNENLFYKLEEETSEILGLDCESLIEKS